MKMPRPIFRVPQGPDCFGLYPPTLLELEEDARARVVAVEKGVAGAFASAVVHLGDEKARRLFATASRRTKRGGSKHLAPNRDELLLTEHSVASQIGETIPVLARRLYAAQAAGTGPTLGNSAEAITTQLRKLLQEREARDRAALRAARLWRWSARHYPPTLLGEMARGEAKA